MSHWLPLSTGFGYFLIFSNLLDTISLQQWFPCLDLCVSRMASGGCNRDAQCRTMAFYSSWAADNPHLCIWEQAFLSSSCYSAGWPGAIYHMGHGALPWVAVLEDFLFRCACQGNCWRRMAKAATQRQKVMLKQLHKHEIWKSSWGSHRPWMCPQHGLAEVSREWKEPGPRTVKATLWDVLLPAAKNQTPLANFLFLLYFFK